MYMKILKLNTPKNINMKNLKKIKILKLNALKQVKTN